jgi:hypothetical protein
LVEEFGRGVEVVVCSGVGAANDHDCVAGGVGGVVDAVVVDGRLEEVRVGFEPVVALEMVAVCVARYRDGLPFGDVEGRGEHSVDILCPSHQN